MRNDVFPNLEIMIKSAIRELLDYGSVVKNNRWQGVDMLKDMWEVCNVYLRANIPATKDELARQIKPDLPWADDHFKERVGGIPLNPGEQYKNWPFYKNNVNTNDKMFKAGEVFSHTYMERYWPKRAGESLRGKKEEDSICNWGIRYSYGDLNDVIELLKKDPYTRQAYLPVWFPEDTGVLHCGRVPCTIGYHFILRDGKLHIHYQIRACDALRHFRNDVYLTCRLLHWVHLKLCQLDNETWEHVKPGILTMDIISFHVFNIEKNMI